MEWNSLLAHSSGLLIGEDIHAKNSLALGEYLTAYCHVPFVKG